MEQSSDLEPLRLPSLAKSHHHESDVLPGSPRALLEGHSPDQGKGAIVHAQLGEVSPQHKMGENPQEGLT
jgi:hypothetical protein